MIELDAGKPICVIEQGIILQFTVVDPGRRGGGGLGSTTLTFVSDPNNCSLQTVYISSTSLNSILYFALDFCEK